MQPYARAVPVAVVSRIIGVMLALQEHSYQANLACHAQIRVKPVLVLPCASHANQVMAFKTASVLLVLLERT